jgi:hypothetical protein
MNMRKSRLFLAGMILPLFLSCAGSIQGSLARDSSGTFTVSASIEPGAAALIRGLRNMAGASGAADPSAPVLDGGDIALSMSAAPGISSVSFRNTGSGSIEGPVNISRIDDFLTPAAGKGFITLEQNAAGASRLSIDMDRESGPGILSLVSPEISMYLSALMAPLATGEALTKKEYLDLVSSVYRPQRNAASGSSSLADEITRGALRAYIDFPGPVVSVQGGTFSGSRAEFNIPLLDLLVLETPLHYEVAWK